MTHQPPWVTDHPPSPFPRSYASSTWAFPKNFREFAAKQGGMGISGKSVTFLWNGLVQLLVKVVSGFPRTWLIERNPSFSRSKRSNLVGCGGRSRLSKYRLCQYS